MRSSSELPFVDEHTRLVSAPQEQTWAALQDYVERLVASSHGVLFRLLGTVPRSGFEVVGGEPEREIVLSGRHRFSTYRLVFRVTPEGERTRLHALTYADFPGLRGRLYRTALMMSTGHRRATQRMLATVAGRARPDQSS